MSHLVHNCTLFENGCFILEESSHADNCSAYNMLCSNSSKRWIGKASEKPYCVIDLSCIKERPEQFTCISFLCDKCSPDNAAKVDAYIRPYDTSWACLGSFYLQKCAGWQHFSFQRIQSKNVKELKLILPCSFGGKLVYLTQVSLGSQEIDFHNDLAKETAMLKQKVKQNEETIARLQKEYIMLSQLVQKLQKCESEDEFNMLNRSDSFSDDLQDAVQQKEYEILH